MNPMRERFKKEVDKSVEKYAASIPFDNHLYSRDIAFYICQRR